MMQHLPTGSQMQAQALVALCPSFSSYCSNEIAEFASRAMEAMDREPARELPEREERDEEGEARDFEFTFVGGGSELPPLVVADEIFHNGRIRPLCPVIHEALLSHAGIGNQDEDGPNMRNLRKRPSRMPLKKLMSEERDSCSSSEADELDGIAPETYCAGTPKSPGASRTRSKSNSNSTHCSKRWKLKDMLSD